MLLERVGDRHLFNREIFKELANLRVVIDRKQELSFESRQMTLEGNKIILREIVVVELHSVVGWVEIKESLGPVIFPKHLLIRERLDQDILQAFVSGLN